METLEVLADQVRRGRGLDRSPRCSDQREDLGGRHQEETERRRGPCSTRGDRPAGRLRIRARSAQQAAIGGGHEAEALDRRGHIHLPTIGWIPRQRQASLAAAPPKRFCSVLDARHELTQALMGRGRLAGDRRDRSIGDGRGRSGPRAAEGVQARRCVDRRDRRRRGTPFVLSVVTVSRACGGQREGQEDDHREAWSPVKEFTIDRRKHASSLCFAAGVCRIASSSRPAPASA